MPVRCWRCRARWLPAGLTVDEVRGTVAGTLRIHNLRYRDPAVGMDLAIDDAVLEFAALALLSRRLHVERAQVDGVRLALFTPTTASPPAGARDPWAAPLDMQVDELRLARGELQRTNARALHGAQAESRGELDRQRHRGALARAGEPGWTAHAVGARGSAAAATEGAEGRVSLAPRRARVEPARWTRAARTRRLELAAALESPVSMKLAATLAGRSADGERPAWRAHVSVPRFDPHPLVDSDAFETLALELDAEGDLETLALRGSLSIDQERVFIDSLNLARREQLLEITALKLRLNSQPAAVTGHARLSLDASRPSSAELAWGEFRLPEAWAGANFRCSGKLALTTVQQRYAMNGMARVARAEKHSTLTLRVDGSSERLRIQELELTQLPGALSVKGDIELGKPLRWTLDAQARAFDPSLFFDDWPGALDFDLATQGHWPEAGPRAEFKLARLQGKLRARTISGSGDVALGPDLKPSGRVRLQSGGAKLEAVATSGARPGIDARLEVASLEEWHKDLRGKVSAEANSLGRWPNIELEARVTASQVRQGDTAFDAATLKLHAQNARAPRGSAELSAQGLTLAGFKFSDVSAKLNGDAHAHDIALDARGEPLSVVLRAHGSLSGRAAQSRWSGTIGELGLDVAHVPPLKLTEPAQLTVSRDSLELANTCLKGDEIAVCAAVRRDPRSFAANYSVRALPLAVLVALAAPDAAVSVQGTFEGNGDLQRTSDGSLSGRATLNSRQRRARAAWRRQGAGARVPRLRHRRRPVARYGERKLRGILPRQGELEGALTLAMAESDPSLGGRAALKLRDLAPLAIWVPQLANLRGSGEIAAEVAGTLRAPRVGLTVRATGLDAEVPMLGLHLREGNFNATLEPGGRFQAEGSIASGEGTLRISGTRVEPQGLELKLSGSNFLAANIPGARVTMAPDLALAGKPGSLALTGIVKIEDADVNLEKLSFARSYRASPDVVIVDREVKVKETVARPDHRRAHGVRRSREAGGIRPRVHGQRRAARAREARSAQPRRPARSACSEPTRPSAEN